MAEGELCKDAARGGTCDDGADRRLDPAPSIRFSDHDEPVAVPETTAIVCGQRTDAGWNGRSKRRLRSRLRKREPVQSGIQQILRPAANAPYKKPASRGFYFDQVGKLAFFFSLPKRLRISSTRATRGSGLAFDQSATVSRGGTSALRGRKTTPLADNSCAEAGTNAKPAFADARANAVRGCSISCVRMSVIPAARRRSMIA